jgi:osmoprotectant transport system substrate-binding protein
MDLGLLYQALQQKKIDMAAGNSTDAQLSNPRFMALQDDKKAFPPYTACYVVREALIQQRPGVRWALTLLQNRISDETMRNLNRRVDVDHQPVARVAHDFLINEP